MRPRSSRRSRPPSRRCAWRHGEPCGWNHWRAGQRLVELRHDRLAVADERDLGRHVLVHLLGEMSSWMTRTSGLKRGGRPKCRIQFSRAPIRTTTSASCRARCAPRRPTAGGRRASRPCPSARRRNGSWVRSMNARTSSSARGPAPCPCRSTTSGRSADCSASSARSMSIGIAWVRGGSGHVGDLLDLVLVDTSRGSRRRGCRGSVAPGRP